MLATGVEHLSLISETYVEEGESLLPLVVLFDFYICTAAHPPNPPKVKKKKIFEELSQ